MGKVNNIVDTCMLAIGTTYSLANIEHVLGIIILVIQLLWIFSKLIVKIVNTVKNGDDIDELDDEVTNILGSLEDIRENLEAKEDNEHGYSTESK